MVSSLYRKPTNPRVSHTCHGSPGGLWSVRINSTEQTDREGFGQNTAAKPELSTRKAARSQAWFPGKHLSLAEGQKAAHPDRPEKQSPHANPSLSRHHCLSSGSAQPAGATAACVEEPSWVVGAPCGSG